MFYHLLKTAILQGGAALWLWLFQGDPTDIINMFPEEKLEMFGAFSLVITALLWFIGYLLLQVRSYKRLYLDEVDYNKELAEAETERSRIALQTMEKVRQTMQAQMKKGKEEREAYLKKVESIKNDIEKKNHGEQ